MHQRSLSGFEISTSGEKTMQQRMHGILGLPSLAAVLLIAGCAGTVKNMQEAPAGSAEPVPQPGKAMVVFLRPSGVGFAIQSSVFELKDTQPAMAGILAAKTKVAYQVDPGKRTFMAISESAEFMAAELLPGKTYYAYVSPRMGMWKARFALEPKHRQDLDTAEFKTDLQECRWVELTPQSSQWMYGNMASIQSKRAEYLGEWQSKPESERPGLRPEDGR
jgi:hypothetical protein